MNQLPRSQRSEQFVQEIGELLIDTQRPHQRTEPTQGVLEFADYLYAARTMLPWTENEFASHLGMSAAELCALEHGLLPRSVITADLMKRIAHVLGEDEEILFLILDGGRPTGQRAAIAETWSPRGNQMHWNRFNIATKFINHLYTHKGSGSHYLFRSISSFLTWGNLLYNRQLVLLQRLRAINIWQGFSSKPPQGLLFRPATAIITILMVYSFTFGMMDPATFFTTDSLVPATERQPVEDGLPIQSKRYSSIYLSQFASLPNDLILRLRYERSQAGIYNGIFPLKQRVAPTNLAVTPAYREIQNVRLPAQDEMASYRIIYGKQTSLNNTSSQPFINVNQDRFAAIQFLTSTTVSSRRCITSGRFDLCPI